MVRVMSHSSWSRLTPPGGSPDKYRAPPERSRADRETRHVRRARGTRRAGRATTFKERKPKQIRENRAAEHEEGKRAQETRARNDVPDVSQRERERQQH